MEKIMISKAEYETLLRESALLSCLQNNGVDNWIGYDNAIEEFDQEYAENCENDYEDDHENE